MVQYTCYFSSYKWPYCCVLCDVTRDFGVANGTSKNVGLGKFWQYLEISEASLISLEALVFAWFVFTFLSLETFHQRVSGSNF